MELKLKIRYMKLFLRAANICDYGSMALINKECLISGFDIRGVVPVLRR